MTAFVSGPVSVRVPATSANLGPGFDTLGLALALHDEVRAEVTSSGLDITVESEVEGEFDVPRDESHLVVRAMRAAFDELGAQPTGLALTCANRIPHARGLGSSAAAIVAGILLARALVADGAVRMDEGAVLALASAVEGHPDNVAPCLLGGLTIAWRPDGSEDDVAFRPHIGCARAVRRDPDPAVVPVVLVPPFTASTERARGLLPATVPHADAAFSAGRAALLVAALTGTPQALFDATEDRLHQQYRAPALPASIELVGRLRAAGLPAVVSGAGPTVLVLARGDVEAESAQALAPSGWAVETPEVDLVGAVVTTPLP